MQTFTLSGNDFFDRVSYPVLLAQGQSVQYFNQAAAELFRLQATPLAEGSPVPEPLEIQRGAGISARRLAGEEWVITSREVDAGTLYLLHQEQGEDSRSRIWLHQLAERMPGTHGLHDRRDPGAGTQPGRDRAARNERYLALLQKSYYRMLRLAGNVETCASWRTAAQSSGIRPRSLTWRGCAASSTGRLTCWWNLSAPS